MPAEISTQTVTFFVPLMLVIVERLTNLARSLANQPAQLIDSRPLFMPGEEKRYLPNLGRLNHLHATNMALLAGAFILIAAIEASAVKNILGLLVFVIWIQLPLLEIDEYGEIRDNVVYPWSLYFHIVISIVIAAFIAGFGGFDPGEILETADLFSPTIAIITQHQQQAGAGILLAALWLIGVVGFLLLFEREAKSIEGDAQLSLPIFE
ncbi:MAG: hypothetical protein ABEI76_02610 [Halobacteriales archaeon]